MVLAYPFTGKDILSAKKKVNLPLSGGGLVLGPMALPPASPELPSANKYIHTVLDLSEGEPNYVRKNLFSLISWKGN